MRIPAVTMRRFWTMVAHFHGQTWNSAAELLTGDDPLSADGGLL